MMDEKKIYILWRTERGVFSPDPPTKEIVASTISETALKNLAQDHHVFILELDKDKMKIKAKKL